MPAAALRRFLLLTSLAVVGCDRGSEYDGPIPKQVEAEPPPPPPSSTGPLPSPASTLKLPALSEKQRNLGHHECMFPETQGLGPYRAYQQLPLGKLAVPQKGGHDSSFGFDVLVHFHGSDAARKMIVPVARGISFLAVDLGVGSGVYEERFKEKGKLKKLRELVEEGLQKVTGEEQAHIRRFGLSAWSAGYGAINSLLRHGDVSTVDAVVLLDGFHGSWAHGTPDDHGQRTTKHADLGYLEPLVEYAQRAAKGKGLFLLTHTKVAVLEYPSVRLSTQRLLQRMKIDFKPATPVRPGNPQFPLYQTARQGNFFVWGFEGRMEHAHCDHLRHLARVVRDVLEPRWNTPRMDRKVPPTPAPELGGGAADAGAGSDGGTAPAAAADAAPAPAPAPAPVPAAPAASSEGTQ